MAMTFGDIKQMVTDLVPNNGDAATYNKMLVESIKDAIEDAPPIRETATFDAIGDGFTTRFSLLGRDVQLAVINEQDTPTGVNTAGQVGPSLAPTLSAAAGGTLAAGKYYVAISYYTTLGETQISPYATITLTDNQKITVTAITIPAGVIGVEYYLSLFPSSADIRATQYSTTGLAQDLTTLPPDTANTPLVDFTSLQSLAPNLNLEPGFGVDGKANVNVTTITFGTAPTLGQRIRISYTRRAIMPTLDTDIVGLPNDFLRVAVPMHMHKNLAANHVGGDATRHLALFDKYDAMLMDLKAKRTVRPLPRIVSTNWV